MKYPDLDSLKLLIVIAADGDHRLAKVAMLARDWENPIHATIDAMRDARKWARGESLARSYWAKRGVVWQGAGCAK